MMKVGEGYWLYARTTREAFRILALSRALPWEWESTGNADWLRIRVRVPEWWVRSIVSGHPDLFRLTPPDAVGGASVRQRKA